MSNPYDYINAINAGKDLTKGEFDEKGYVPFITNRQFSYFQDTVLAANEMNEIITMQIRNLSFLFL
jgi:hypothetical protein